MTAVQLLTDPVHAMDGGMFERYLQSLDKHLVPLAAYTLFDAYQQALSVTTTAEVEGSDRPRTLSSGGNGGDFSANNNDNREYTGTVH